MSSKQRSDSHKRRISRRDGEPSHWLAEGWDGASALFDDVDLFGFLVDAALTTRVHRIAHQFRADRGTRPLAVVVPPASALWWYAAYLSLQFEVCLWTEEIDPFIDQACDHFGIERFLEDIPPAFSGLTDVYLIADSSWSSQGEFLSAISKAEKELSLEGCVFAILRVRIENDVPFAVWADGSQDALAVLQEVLPKGAEFTLEPVQDYANSMNDFVQRHRQFFGKNVQELCAARLREEDIVAASKSFQAAALVSVWN